MSEEKKIVDLIGDQELKASETIEVRQFTCAIYAKIQFKT